VSRQLRNDLLTGLSFANLLLFAVWVELLTARGQSGYFSNLSRGTYLAAMLNVTLLGMGTASVMTLARRASHRAWLRLARLTFLILLIIPLERIRGQLGFRLADVLAWFSPTPYRRLALFAVVLGVAYGFFRLRGHLIRVASAAVLFASPFAAVTFAHATWAAATLLPPKIAAHPETRVSPSRAAHARRVVLLVFDELDQRLAFDDRPAGLALPELDRLRATAVYASHASPSGPQTDVSMPALIISKPVAAVRPQGPSELGLTFPGTDSLVPWGDEPNVFTKAQQLGARTGLIGWYHPYCRVLARDLNRCYWEPFYSVVSRRAHAGVAGNMVQQLRSLWPWNGRSVYIEMYQRMLDSAKAFSTDTSLTFVLLHLPVPHLPPIYDRQAQRFTQHKYSYNGYLDNLVLMDRALGDLRKSLEGAGLWEQTALVLISDHAFREAQRIDGRLDGRVPFLVKLSGLSDSLTYAFAVNTFVVDDLVLSLIRGDVRTTSDVARLLDRLRASSATDSVRSLHSEHDPDGLKKDP
jgi:sulfatase-like protein